MVAYTYTGTLTDIGVEVLTERMPRLTVRPEKQGIFGPDGPVSDARRVIPLDPITGEFTLDLIASADLTPPTRYVLELVFFDDSADGTPSAGYDIWKFTALPGGGPIADMGDGPPTKLYIGPPWPSTPRPGAYFDTETNDLGYYDLEV